MTREDQLADGWLSGTLTEPEVREFLGLLTEDHGPLRERVLEWLNDPGFSIWADTAREEPLFQMLMYRTGKQARYAKIKRWLAVAASVIILLGAGIFFFRQHTLPTAQEQRSMAHLDIPPGGNKATLLLANGSKIILDSARTGLLAKQNGSDIVISGSGKLSYTYLQKNVKQADETAYNVLSTPRGGTYQLALSDGTKVWLNAASSIRYPTAFTGSERKVEVTGEVYMEVSHKENHPFYVRVGDQTIEDIGTKFNINAYSDEGQVKTTLVDGSVRVSQNNSSKVLKPGEQSEFSLATATFHSGPVSVSQVIAWKNGMFDFSNSDLKTVMRQLSRWYNVDISYEGPVEQRHFSGMIGRSLTLDQLLSGLKREGIHYRFEDGNKLTIIP